jgi:hypothetical protein
LLGFISSKGELNDDWPSPLEDGEKPFDFFESGQSNLFVLRNERWFRRPKYLTEFGHLKKKRVEFKDVQSGSLGWGF